AGSSAVVERGFVTYSNAAKMDLLGVLAATLERHGAVSAETAAEMVRGALARSPADLAIAVTGIAGPGGATATKPVGLVFIGAQRRGGAAEVERHVFPGDRRAVRTAALERALALLERAAIG
ncbi:MAG: nicotinamide-nucleotide amidohydrolase family protein, partial [Rhodocyclaceae bacterium]|nr:nicotinamide-nucleotide amidohydrolase family protein [Rhodocyclaceae bacterium]